MHRSADRRLRRCPGSALAGQSARARPAGPECNRTLAICPRPSPRPAGSGPGHDSAHVLGQLRKAAERLMHEARLHRRIDLIEDLDAFVWEADPATFQFTYVGKGAERILGYSLEDWLSRPTFWLDVLHPEDRDRAAAHCRQA